MDEKLKAHTHVLDVEGILNSKGLSLPNTPKPSGNYLFLNQVGNVIYMSGITCKFNGEIAYKGKVGKDLTIQEGYEAARITTLNHLSILKDYLGDFNKIDKIVKITGYVNCEPTFTQVPDVINGTSDLLVELFGDKGKHARCAVGVASLPGNAAVETDMIILLID
ncbi:RidA family protein [Schinkia azotoformans]|uniref:RidA family protein n=1 Tax=Schinkia azotoformans TaxID=1454 RepID=UPI002DBFB8B6|nr:RidA family protein [Schinkia azotoformans]MEC1714424.1 RidA family protein [Schinkia azotoformans]MEC1740481.1 RidA family protein [Schinkia azotoformans]MEC1768774.1 RidA family protein [Schinkia azotoformans]MEC1788217.1 RidA family protein [Schinkia azotoformans]MED4374771.1 RidA family protein [Schinkia azotoformans]